MSDSASDRPIFTLLHARLGACFDKPFGRYHWQYKAWCSPDEALRADDSETTQVETMRATKEVASPGKAAPPQVTHRKCQLTRRCPDPTIAETIEASV
jgi:hypothetical protein